MTSCDSGDGRQPEDSPAEIQVVRATETFHKAGSHIVRVQKLMLALKPVAHRLQVPEINQRSSEV